MVIVIESITSPSIPISEEERRRLTEELRQHEESLVEMYQKARKEIPIASEEWLKTIVFND